MVDISVIIPVYNVGKYLVEALESVLSSSHQNFEVVCVNDGSSDESGEILDDFSERDERVKVVDQENQGVSVARNTGIAHAEGEYVCFFDADDVMHPQFLELMLEGVRRTGSDIAWCEYRLVGENHRFDSFVQYALPARLDVYSDIFDSFISGDKNPQVSSCNKLYKKDLIREICFDRGIRFAEDYIWTHKVLYHSQRSVCIPFVLYFYRTRSGSATRSGLSEKMIDDHLFCAETLSDYFKDKRMNVSTRKRLNALLAKMCVKHACFVPRRRQKKNYMEYWEKYAPAVNRLISEERVNSHSLDWRNRIKLELFMKGHFRTLLLLFKL